MTRRYAPLVERIAQGDADPWALHWRARQAAAAGADVIVLSVGDPDIDTPLAVADAAVAAIRGGDTHYIESAGRPALRAAIAARHHARSGQPVSADNVIVLNGAQNGLFVASLCLAGPGDEVLAFDPMYATYPATIQASGAALVRVPAPASKGFHPDLDALEALLTPHSRVLFLATPNNPTGVVLSDAQIERIAALARRHGLWLVSDEVYAGTADGGRVPSLGQLLPEQVLTVASLSKSHAMTGWRSGWIVGPTDFIRHADELAQCMLFGLPGFIQAAALQALTAADDAELKVREFCRERLRLFCEALHAAPGIRLCRPDAGMFVLIDVRDSGIDAAEFVERLYRSEGVSLLDGAVFGRQSRGFVRACYALDEARLREAARRIRRFCDSLTVQGPPT